MQPNFNFVVPVAGMFTWVSITALIVAVRYGTYRQRQVTLRLAIEKGVDPHNLNLKGMPLRRRLLIGGTIWSAAGLLVGIAMQMVVVEAPAPRFVAVFGWIPFAVGVSLLAVSRYVPEQD